MVKNASPRCSPTRVPFSVSIGPGDSSMKRARNGAKRRCPHEADAGTVRLVVWREPRAPGHVAHGPLVQGADGEHRAGELRLIERVEEVALILVGVGAPEQPHAVGGVLDSGVVAGRDALGAESARVLDERVELHLPIADHVGIRGHAGLDVADELHEHVVPVGVGAVHRVQGNAEPVADTLRVGEVLLRRAVAVIVVLFPVLHEHRLHRGARFHQTHQRHGGIHAARYRHHCRGIGARAGTGAATGHCRRASRSSRAPPPARSRPR